MMTKDDTTKSIGFGLALIMYSRGSMVNVDVAKEIGVVYFLAGTAPLALLALCFVDSLK
jgi:hypothetical protein